MRICKGVVLDACLGLKASSAAVSAAVGEGGSVTVRSAVAGAGAAVGAGGFSATTRSSSSS